MGYGTALPEKDENAAVILDLSELNRVLYFDPKTGIVTVQPGVTQSMLRAFLDKNGARNFMVPVSGAGPNCSVLGNALERGYGITPYTDHFAAVNSIKAYLPDGSLYEPALSVLDQSGSELVDKSFKWGVGPYVDGIFSQSGFGIVIEATLALKEKPEGFDSFYLRFKRDEDFIAAIGAVADILKMHEGVVGSINLMDRRRVISMVADNPNGPESHIVMSDEQVDDLSKKHDVAAWTIAGSIYGTRRVVAAARKDIKQRVRGLGCQTLFSSGLLIRLGRWILNRLPDSVLRREREMIRALDMGIEIMRGIPNQVALPLSYWRTPRPAGDMVLDPSRDGCGLLWYAPLLPMDAGKMRTFIEMVRDICPKHHIEPMITLTNFSHHCSDSTIPILFNLSNSSAVKDAKNCLSELVQTGLKKGFVPYRLNIDQQQTLLDEDAVCWALIGKIGNALDPKGVVSSGRYGA